MFMDPVNGLFAHLLKAFGFQPVDCLSAGLAASIIGIVSWQWLPFATLILLTALQSLDSEQLEAAEMDGAPCSNGSGSSCCRILRARSPS